MDDDNDADDDLEARIRYAQEMGLVIIVLLFTAWMVWWSITLGERTGGL
ncbi:MAG: hypothetical protein AB7L84_11535 [Acidimicrobiia bacterium]